MALVKEFTKITSFHCNQEELKNAIIGAIDTLELKLNKSNKTEDEIYFSASEKMNVLSTNCPVSYVIKGKKINDSWQLLVKCWAKMTSITQHKYTGKRPQEFINLVQDHENFKTLSE